MSQADELMNALSQTADMVATWTGVKAQFTDAGWSEENAELLVLELLRQAIKLTPSG